MAIESRDIPQILRQIKCLLFKIWRLKFTLIPKKSHLALGRIWPIVSCAKIDTKVYSKNLLVKSSQNDFMFFTCILPNYVTHESQKEFWKNSHFENMRAGFLLSCQNWLRQNTPKIMHFQAWKNKDFKQYSVVAFDPIKIFTH